MLRQKKNPWRNTPVGNRRQNILNKGEILTSCVEKIICQYI
jgi:hypothetical protein